LARINYEVIFIQGELEQPVNSIVENENQSKGDILIHSQDLTKQFNDRMVVNRVSFEIPAGSIFGFIGPSGCGKTTTVRLLTGIYHPTNGEVSVFGVSPKDFTLLEREKIGYMPQHFVLYPDLTIQENLNFAASIYGVGRGRGRKIHELLEFVELDDHRKEIVRHISGGMKRRLSLASTLVHSPQLLFLDEPTGGIDPVLRRKFWDFFGELRASGKTLFITTQYVSEAVYCDLVGLMLDGSLLVVDSPDGLRHRALGGEVVVLRTRGPLNFQHAHALADLPFVVEKLERVDENEVRVVVKDASTAMPDILQWAQAHDLAIDSIQEYLPPFDDVFISLIRRSQHDA
jgi:ABC-2 type transport system ATP-binding protein